MVLTKIPLCIVLLLWLFTTTLGDKGSATCVVSGDPHYRTFDGQGYLFMGVCDYVVSKDVDKNFEVRVKNERCVRRGVSCASAVTVIVKNFVMRITRGGTFTLFGAAKKLPLHLAGIKVDRTGKRVTIRTDIGLTVQYDGVINVYITISARYKGRVRGLCGNYNGVAGNDEYIHRNLHQTTNINEFADSWNVEPGCGRTPDVTTHPCRMANNKAQEAKKKCQLLKEQPFVTCHDTVKPESGFIADCEYDVCACDNYPESCLCEEFDAYATVCSILGKPITWKKRSQFAECSTPCAEAPCRNGATCTNRGKDYNCTCAEGYSGKQCDIKTCEKPKKLGMESRRIKDSQITASTHYSSYIASWARLNHQHGWYTRHRDHKQWLKVDFKYRATITAILSRGLGSSSYFVRTYSLSYSDDGTNFKIYKKRGEKRKLNGNENSKCIAKTTIEPIIVARFIRIHPLTWHGYIAMRLEFIGCFEGQPCAEEPCQNDARCTDVGGYARCDCRNGYYGDTCEQRECKKPVLLGVESGQILDTQLTASSEYKNCEARNARLKFHGEGARIGAWCAASTDHKQWLEVNFIRQATVTDILTQGRYGANYFVRSYTVSYSNDGLNYLLYTVKGEVKHFKGNHDWNSIVKNTVSPVIVTKQIRIHPKQPHGLICLRVDFRGCVKDWPCEAQPCSNGGTCFDYRGDYRCACAKGWGGKKCDKNIDDPCNPSPCQNGGTCLPFRGSYLCSCAEGWAGKNCQQNIEKCQEKAQQDNAGKKKK